jgi:hypothetical protein
MEIIKSTGEKEAFSKNKLCLSLRKSGAPKNLADSICAEVGDKIRPGMSTTKIFREALRYLAKQDLTAAVRYSLHRGIADLGPAGFVFEKYIEAILESMGYQTRRDVLIQGACVRHEIDVIAEKDRTHYLLEMKYHNEPGLRTHIPVVMYADARLMDIAKVENKREKNKYMHKMWIVTNTKFTETAITYARCRNIRLTGWNYPRGETLEDIIVRTKMYPVTILPSVNPETLSSFASKNIVLAQDLLPYTAEELSKLCAIPKSTSEKIVSEVQELFD